MNCVFSQVVMSARRRRGGGEATEGKMKRLVAELRVRHAEGAKRKNVISASLKELGYEV